MKDADVNLRSLLQECGDRCCAISNSKNTEQAEKEAQVQELVELIDKMVQNNQGAYFSDPIYKGTLENLRKLEEILEKSYADQLIIEIQKVEKEYAQACEKIMQEKEGKIKSLNMEYEEKLRNIRRRLKTIYLAMYLMKLGSCFLEYFLCSRSNYCFDS